MNGQRKVQSSLTVECICNCLLDEVKVNSVCREVSEDEVTRSKMGR